LLAQTTEVRFFMHKVIVPALLWILAVSAATLYGSRSFAAPQQQGQEQQAPPAEQQQSPSTSHAQGASSATVQSVTGCLVKSDSGYSLKTDSDTYPIETDRDLSQYVNKQIKVTGILEHHNAAAPSTENSNAIAVTDLRLRLVASVVGDCKQ
jgi:hypothetical protein